MKTHTSKITITLPSAQDVAAGLDMHAMNPRLIAAEQKHAAAVQGLEAARARLAELERIVERLPARVLDGQAGTNDLHGAMAQRDAAALLVPPCEQAVNDAAKVVERERKRAADARQAEIIKRRAVLESAVEQIAPVLERIREIELVLAKAADPMAMGLNLDWPSSLAEDMARSQANRTASEQIIRMQQELAESLKNGAA